MGLGNFNNTSTPQYIKGVDCIKSVSCGGGHTVALTAKGEVYLWGDGRNGLAQVNHLHILLKINHQ